MLLVANTTRIGRSQQIEKQNPRELLQTAQLLLQIKHRDPAWYTRAMLEIDTLQRLIQQERCWLDSLSQTQSKRHLHELINDTMTCLLSLEFAVAADQGR